jgi:hypothetical protein
MGRAESRAPIHAVEGGTTRDGLLVQPLMERLSVAIGHGCGRSEHIWADANGPWDTTKLTKVMKQRSGEDLGVALGTMDYRHAAVGMSRRFVGAEFARGYQAENEEVDEPEVESDDPNLT